MRIGSAIVRCGGIGWVATEQVFRKRGLMDSTARESLRAMRSLGYDISMLCGIENYYDRFGYVRAWPETGYTLKADDLPKEPLPGRLRQAASARTEPFITLYNHWHATATGAQVRKPRPSGRARKGAEKNVYSWRDKAGEIKGYVIAHREGTRLVCTETVGEAEEILRVLGQLVRAWHCSEVHFAWIWEGSALGLLLRQGNCRVETRYVRSGWWMIKVVNLNQTLKKMEGELTQRLRSSCWSKWQGQLVLTGEKETVVLALRGGKVKVGEETRSPHALEGGPALAQLLIGTEEPRAVMASHDMKVSGEATQLVCALFPAQHPNISYADRY